MRRHDFQQLKICLTFSQIVQTVVWHSPYMRTRRVFCFVLIIRHSFYLEYGSARFPSSSGWPVRCGSSLPSTLLPRCTRRVAFKILDTITSYLSRPQALVAFTRRLAPVDNNEVRVATPLEAGHETNRHMIPPSFQSNLTKCLLGHYHLLFLVIDV